MEKEKNDYHPKSTKYPPDFQIKYDQVKKLLNQKEYKKRIQEIDQIDNFYGVDELRSFIEYAISLSDKIIKGLKEELGYPPSPDEENRVIDKCADAAFYTHYLPLIKQRDREYFPYNDSIIPPAKMWETSTIKRADLMSKFVRGFFYVLWAKTASQVAKEKHIELRKLLYILRKINFPLAKTPKKEYTIIYIPLFEAISPSIKMYLEYEKNYLDWLKYLGKGYHKSRAVQRIKRSKYPWLYEKYPPNLQGRLAVLPVNKQDSKKINTKQTSIKFPYRNEIINSLKAIKWKEYIIKVKQLFAVYYMEKVQESTNNQKLFAIFSKETENFLDLFIKQIK